MPQARFRGSVSTQSPWKFNMRNGFYKTQSDHPLCSSCFSDRPGTFFSTERKPKRIVSPLLSHPEQFSLLLSVSPPACADSLVLLLLNYALLFPEPEEPAAEASLLTLFCIPSMCYDLFWVLFAAKLLTQLQFCFHVLIGWECSLLWVPGEGSKSFSKGTIYTFVKGCFFLFLNALPIWILNTTNIQTYHIFVCRKKVLMKIIVFL